MKRILALIGFVVAMGLCAIWSYADPPINDGTPVYLKRYNCNPGGTPTVCVTPVVVYVGGANAGLSILYVTAGVTVYSDNVDPGSILALNNLPNSQSSVYTVPTSITTDVSHWSLYNTNAAAANVTLYVAKNGGVTNFFKAYTLQTGDQVDALDHILNLGAMDKLVAISDKTGVNEILTGVERQ